MPSRTLAPIPVSAPTTLGERRLLRDYLQLSKSRIVSLVVMSAACGYTIASGGRLATLAALLGGTALLASGANALNQYWERDLDARMARTRSRPLPAGRIGARTALIFGLITSILGFAGLFAWVSLPTALLGFLAFAIYVAIYTPMKRRTPLCTLVGALPGAIPPLMGWSAAATHLGAGGWFVFALLFLWQLPHFMAISWIYRDDYRNAGFAVLSVDDFAGMKVAGWAMAFALILFVVSLVPFLFFSATVAYVACAASAGAVVLWTCARFLGERSSANASRLFAASNGYLIVVLTALMLFVRA